jgi:hypothetical protein
MTIGVIGPRLFVLPANLAAWIAGRRLSAQINIWFIEETHGLLVH